MTTDTVTRIDLVNLLVFVMVSQSAKASADIFSESKFLKRVQVFQKIKF